MSDQNKTKAELIEELAETRRRAADLETKYQKTRQRLQFLTHLLNCVGDAVVAADLDGKVLYWNKGAETLYGYSAEAAKQMHLTELIMPMGVPAKKEYLREVLETGAWRMQSKQKREDGQPFWVDMNVSLLTDPSGRPTGLLGIDRDITELKQMEEALRRSKDRLAEAQRLAHLGNYEFEVSSGEVIWSDEVFCIVGRDPAQGAPPIEEYLQIVHPDDRARAAQIIERTISHKQPFDCEYRLVTGDGTAKYVQSVGSAIEDEAGAVTRIFGTLLDITARKQAEDALQESLARYRAILDTIPDSMFLLDQDGTFLDYHAIDPHDLYVDPDEFLGRRVTDVMPPAYAELVMDHLRRALQTGETQTFENQLVCDEGGILYFENRLVKSGKGEVLNITRNITDRKEGEATLAEYTRLLHVLYETALDIGAVLDSSTLLQRIVRRAVALLDADQGGCIYLYRPEQGVLQLMEGFGLDTVYNGLTLKPGEGMAGRVFETKQPLIVDDYRAWEGRAPVFADAPFTAVLEIPLFWQGKVIGVLSLNAGTERRTFASEDIWLAEMFAAQVALAIHNAQLYEQVQQRVTQLSMLNEIGRTVSSRLVLEDVLDAIYEQIQRCIPLDFCYIGLYDPETRIVSYPLVYDQGRRYKEASTPLDPSTSEARAIELGEPQLVHRTAEEMQMPSARQYMMGDTSRVSASRIFAPMKIRDRVTGVISVQSYTLNAYTDEHLMLLTNVASQVTVAIENAKLYRQVQESAEFQADLLREVNHRVTNNLAAIVSMLQLAQSAPWAEASLAGRTGLDELISRVQGLATLHDLLSASEWSPLPLSELVEQIIHATWQILPWDKGVSLEVEPSPFHVTPDQSHHLAMIFNELATNTIKYAWRERDAAVVNVSITPVNGRVQLVYRDDGPGYPDEVLQQKRWHVGLNLVQFIVRANLGGDLSIYNDEGAVTTIRFVLETNYKLCHAQETQRDGRGE